MLETNLFFLFIKDKNPPADTFISRGTLSNPSKTLYILDC